MAIFEMLTIRCSEVRWVELNGTLVVGYYGLEEFTLLFWGFMHINFGLRISYSALRGGSENSSGQGKYQNCTIFLW